MLDLPLFDPSDVQQAAAVVHRDGFVVIRNALTTDQLTFTQQGAQRIIAEQTAADPQRQGNRGHHRYSFGSQMHHPQWSQLVDLPTIGPILQAIWNSPNYRCSGAGGDYSLPGAATQHLHSDMGDFLNDPWSAVDYHDLPAPYIVVNFPMVDFTPLNGAIRFVPCTQRSKAQVPSLENEPAWMQQALACATAGSAIIRDVRCWHAGTANQSNQIRAMTSVGYHAPWYHGPTSAPISRDVYQSLSPRGQQLCRHLLANDDASD